MKNNKGHVPSVNRLQRENYIPLLVQAFDEDHFRHDVSTVAIFDKSQTARAVIKAKSSGVLAGSPIVKDAFHYLDDEVVVTARKKDADSFDDQDILFEITGNIQTLLSAERIALNFLLFTSSIATRTARAVKILQPYGIIPIDTRKTLPGYRMISKYAVTMGGGGNHRCHLEQMGLIKDNHIAKAGGARKALERFRSRYPDVPVEIEVETIEQLNEVIVAEPDMLLLDNMTPALLKRASSIIKDFNQSNDTDITCEASGGYTLENLHTIVDTGVDFVSMGSLTAVSNLVDISMDIIS